MSDAGVEGAAAPLAAEIQHSRRRNEQREDCDKRLHNGSLECLAVATLDKERHADRIRDHEQERCNRIRDVVVRRLLCSEHV